MQRRDEAALVQRVADGDGEAFRVLVDAHQRPLSAYARRMLSDNDAADDIVQETFLRLWTQAARYECDASRLTTWLHNIAHNLCIDSFRKSSRISFGHCEDTRVDVTGAPDAARESAQRSAAVRQAIGDLPERQRSALLLCHYQGMSNKEAAQILDLSVDALESLLARARRRLKQELKIDD